MKGTFFVKPLEYKININGESWAQGEKISGELSLTEHGTHEFDLTTHGVHLCYCNTKKLKAKDPKAIEVISSKTFGGGERELSFEFTFDLDCNISESTSNYYIICGDINTPFEVGMLEVQVNPAATISSFVEVFEQFFRFKLKKYKNKKDCIEAAVTAPSSKEWSRIQKLSLQLKMDGKNLEAKFIFDLKNATFESALSKTKDVNLEIVKVLTERDYSIYGTTNQDGICKVVNEVLDQVKLKPIL